jgi:hypothetical protein
MGEKKTTPVFVDDVEYSLEEMTLEQQTLVKHISDLDRKMASAKFNFDQLSVGRSAFEDLLKTSLKGTNNANT